MTEKLFDLRQAARDEVRKAVAEILPGCADCISRQAAISESMEDIEDRSLHDDPATPEDYAEGYDEGIRNAAAIVLQLPSAQPWWIPCSERCPEHRVYVLVTYKPVYGIPDIGIAWYSKSEGKWNTSREVLAWMSLPTPYREGGQDG